MKARSSTGLEASPSGSRGVTSSEILLVYDKDCPICDAYCSAVQVSASTGNLRLINAREDTVLRREITERGLDIDQGMVVVSNGTLHYGADAIHALAQMSSRRGLVNRVSHWLFASPTRARFLYPVFRSVRNLVLKALRKSKINNLGLSDNERF